MLPRKVFARLKKCIRNRKITLLLGARQVGKTTLLKELFNELLKTNKCLFLDLDILSNYEKISTFESLINTLKVNGYEESQKEFFYLFLDEFYKSSAITKIMKNVYDNLENVKIYASGSSSLEIKDKIQESLAGRKQIIEIFPLDFEEFLWFKQKDKLINNLKNLKKLKGDNIEGAVNEFNSVLKEFLIFGGYPEVALQKSKEEKIEILSSIFDLYAKKDLIEYLHIEKILEVKRLIEFLAVNNGQKIKYEEITKLTSLSFIEIKRYLEILEETYLIKIIRPFYRNKNKELVKIPKVYFIDCGVRNFFINNFNSLHLRDDGGFLFEGFIISELLKNGEKNLKFWQDKNNNEVDIIIEKERILPIEIKFKQKLKKEDLNGIRNFLKDYPKIRNGYLINLGTQKYSDKIKFVLPYLLRMI